MNLDSFEQDKDEGDEEKEYYSILKNCLVKISSLRLHK